MGGSRRVFGETKQMKPTILLIAVTAAVIVTGCASAMAEQAEQGQDTATDFFASVHINSKEVMVVVMYELRNPMKLAGASPAVQRAELSHSPVMLSDLFYGNNPG
jgi:hypothetical protein